MEAKSEYGVSITKIEEVSNLDCVILAVAHNEFRKMGIEKISLLFNENLKNSEKVIIDVKGILDRQKVLSKGYRYWRL